MSIMAAAVIAAGTAQAVDLEVGGSAGADVVSAYVFRGATINKEWNVQPYIEVSASDVTLGTWGNFNTDPADTTRSAEFDEIDYYALWDLPLPEDQPVGLSLGYTEYTYPGGDLEADREIGIGLSVDTLLSPELFLGLGVDGPALNKGVYLGLSGSHDYEINEKATISGGATLGFELGDNVENTGVSYLQLVLGASYDIVGISFNYIVETDSDVLVVDEDWYVAFTIAI
jgi:hypothetical protein